MDERRAHTRKSAIRRVEIELLHETPLIRYAGLQEDISVDGCSVSVRRPIAVGTRLRVVWPTHSHVGRVRQCRHDNAGYSLGIMFEKANEAKTAGSSE
jgi:PilZ domain